MRCGSRARSAAASSPQFAITRGLKLSMTTSQRARQLAHQRRRRARWPRSTARLRLPRLRLPNSPPRRSTPSGASSALDLDHVGAVIGEHARRHRAGDHPGEVEHADAASGHPCVAPASVPASARSAPRASAARSRALPRPAALRAARRHGGRRHGKARASGPTIDTAPVSSRAKKPRAHSCGCWTTSPSGQTGANGRRRSCACSTSSATR